MTRMKIPRFGASTYPISLTVVLFCANMGHVTSTISVISQVTEQIVISFDDSPSIYMSDEKAEYGIDGYVVYSNPADACSPLKPPPRYPEDVNWILLAKHTTSTPECTFANKTENAYDAGYAGIIIHNIGSNSTDDFDEAVDPSETIIYATFIGEYHGFLLRDNFSYPSDKYFKSFIRVRHDESVTNQWLVYLVAFLVILCFCALLVVPILMLWNSALSCLDRIRRIRRRKLRVAIINKFPINDWAEGDPQQSCVICLDDFEPHDKVRVLPCSHGFHAECIDPWLQKCKKFCPICKRKVIVLNENVETAASDSDDENTPLLRREPSTSAMNPSINSPTTATAATSTSGGTFVQQRENPFRRAFRLARRATTRQTSAAVAVPSPASTPDPTAGAAAAEPTFGPDSVQSSNGFISTSSSASSSDSDNMPFHPQPQQRPPADESGFRSRNLDPSTYTGHGRQPVLVPEVTVIVNPNASASDLIDTNNPHT